ncbi:MAG TPA: ROK family protein [Pedobacter sp.]|nr:ROK family protein [Pedobacter sp.]
MTFNKFIGIEIGGTKLQLAIGDASGNIEQHMRYVIHAEEGASGIREKISDCLVKWHDELINVSAIGVGFGGPVDWQTGTIQVSHQIKGWEQVNLKDWLEELTNKPVAIDNDANVAALGEAIHGWGNQYKKLFYITLGSGIGGGMVLNEAIYHGKAPGELEIGHLRLDKKGTTLESVCSGWAVNKTVRAYIDAHPDSLLAQLALTHNAAEAILLKPALEQQDAVAQQILHEIADNIAFALSHLVHLFHPDIIVLGGGLSLLEEKLRLPVSLALPRYLMQSFLPPPAVRISKLQENAVPVGALELAKLALKQDLKYT